MTFKKKLITHALLGVLSTGIYADNLPLTKQNLIYTHDQMFNFDIEEYLNKNAPHLAKYSETISHWAGVSSMSPKVLIALMEHQTKLVSVENNKLMNRPFGDLSNETVFREQVRDVSMRLAKFYYYPSENKLLKSLDENPIAKLLSDGGKKLNNKSLTTEAIGVKASVEFANTFKTLFGESSVSNSTTSLVTPSLVPSDLLQLPYTVGHSWLHGGSHSNTGSGTVYSSLDLYGVNSGGWGSDLSAYPVAASAGGTVKIHSSCNMEIIHAGGYSTQYYHLSNIQYSNNSTVSRNASIANYANNKNQALCQGGQSSGPHQHFSLKQNGQYVSLQGVYLSGYKVNVGTQNYDTNCNRFYLIKPNGSKHCAGTALYNPGVGSTPPPPPPPPPPPGSSPLTNGVAKTGLSANKGSELNYTFGVPSGASSLSFTMSGGSGDADIYVKYGSKPTSSSYDCRPYKSGNNETCNISNVQSGTYYVVLDAYSNFSGVSLLAQHNGGSTPPPPPPGGDPVDVSETNISVGSKQWARYYYDLPAGFSTLTASISGGSGDADLYVRFGAQSTLSQYDCRPYKNGNNETCTSNNPAAGRWYFDLYGYQAASGVTLRLQAQ